MGGVQYPSIPPFSRGPDTPKASPIRPLSSVIWSFLEHFQILSAIFVVFHITFCFFLLGTDKFYLSLLGWSLAMMRLIDVLLDSPFLN
jgi:hypothetical protein